MSPYPYAWAVALLVGMSCVLIYIGVGTRRRSETVEQRMERLSASEHPTEEAELSEPFSERMLKPWLRKQVQAIGRLAPMQNIEKLQRKLMQAGYPHGLTVLDFLGVKLLVAMGLSLLSAYLLVSAHSAGTKAMLFSGALAPLGFVLPDFWLGNRVRRRQTEITRALPDALDMLTICVDAGAGLASAMLRISQKWQNALGFEFGKAVAEINIGMTRREALEGMADRTGVADVRSFVAVLVQADQFGLSIAQVLHTQSEQLRQKRWQRADEEARKVPLKLLFPLIFMIFPAMLAVSLGPIFPLLMETLGDLAA
jgi:tight adherence protein C